jgi:PAS domain S-box-containing protein
VAAINCVRGCIHSLGEESFQFRRMMLTMASPPHEPESKQFLEAQLQATLNVIPAYTWYANPSGGLTFVNKRQADYLGLPKEHPLRSGIDTGAAWDSHLTFLHPGDQEYTRRIWSECLRTGSASELSFRVRNGEGAYRWFLCRAEPQLDAQGCIVRWFALLTDIDERKKVEQKLEAQEMELRQILDLTPQLIAVFGPHYRERLFINRTALEYHGLTLEEWRDAAPGALGHPDDSKRVKAIWDRAISSGSAFESEGRLRKSDGSYRWFLIRYNPVRDEEGKVLRWYAACADMTNQRGALISSLSSR